MWDCIFNVSLVTQAVVLIWFLFSFEIPVIPTESYMI